MATTEHERLELYELAKAGVGDRFAELMMRSLPPEPDELVRKADLTAATRELDARIDITTAELRAEMRELTAGQTRTLMLGLVGSITALSITEVLVNLLA